MLHKANFAAMVSFTNRTALILVPWAFPSALLHDLDTDIFSKSPRQFCSCVMSREDCARLGLWQEGAKVPLMTAVVLHVWTGTVMHGRCSCATESSRCWGTSLSKEPLVMVRCVNCVVLTMLATGRK